MRPEPESVAMPPQDAGVGGAGEAEAEGASATPEDGFLFIDETWPWFALQECGRADWAMVQRLRVAGVPDALLAELGGRGDIAAARVALGPSTGSGRSSGLFSFEGPDARLILAVRDGAGLVVDLVALSSSHEDQWELLTGAGDMLGESELYHAVATEARSLRLFSTPMDWLRGGGRGVCVLRWSSAAMSALRMPGERMTWKVDPGVKDLLRAKLAHGGLPLIGEVTERTDRRAA